MNIRKTIRAMQDKNFRDRLSEDDRRQMGSGPSGIVDLEDRFWGLVGGGNPVINNECETAGVSIVHLACQF